MQIPLNSHAFSVFPLFWSIWNIIKESPGFAFPYCIFYCIDKWLITCEICFLKSTLLVRRIGRGRSGLLGFMGVNYWAEPVCGDTFCNLKPSRLIKFVLLFCMWPRNSVSSLHVCCLSLINLNPSQRAFCSWMNWWYEVGDMSGIWLEGYIMICWEVIKLLYTRVAMSLADRCRRLVERAAADIPPPQAAIGHRQIN